MKNIAKWKLVLIIIGLRDAGDATVSGAVFDGWSDGVWGIIVAEFNGVGDATVFNGFTTACLICDKVVVSVDVPVDAVNATLEAIAVVFGVGVEAVAVVVVIVDVVVVIVADDDELDDKGDDDDDDSGGDVTIFCRTKSVPFIGSWIDGSLMWMFDCGDAAPAANGSMVFGTDVVTLGDVTKLVFTPADACDCLRARIRFNWADATLTLYWIISSSKRFRFIGRCELYDVQ